MVAVAVPISQVTEFRKGSLKDNTEVQTRRAVEASKPCLGGWLPGEGLEGVQGQQACAHGVGGQGCVGTGSGRQGAQWVHEARLLAWHSPCSLGSARSYVTDLPMSPQLQWFVEPQFPREEVNEEMDLISR